MPQEQSSNKRIAKNTIMLYIRMLISMLVGLYTSRVVLQTLGVEDYGIYGVVGGVVSMMGFLNASMSGATSRFITFELGKGDMKRVRDTFSSAMIIHIGIALVVILLAETVGLWFLCNKLVIPEGRMEAAHWVYQCSIISAAVGITQSPYTAVIMSREKMDIYAYMELLNVSLKLGIVYLLVIGNFDKLILYALFTLAVSVFMVMLYSIYCIRHYEESHFRCVWNMEMLKPMFSFSIWDLYGNACVSLRTQGISFIINIFWGVALNAASGIANTVYGLLSGLSYNSLTAVRPAIIKFYAKKRYEDMENLMLASLTYSELLYAFFAIPVFFEADYLFGLWLDNVPLYAVLFCRILLLGNFFKIANSIIGISIHATGQIKLLSVVSGTISLFSVPVIYVFIRFFSDNPSWCFIINEIFFIFLLLVDVIIAKVLIPSIRGFLYFKKLFLLLTSILICYLPCFFIGVCMSPSFVRLILSSVAFILFLSFYSYFFLLDRDIKEKISFIINRYLYV